MESNTDNLKMLQQMTDRLIASEKDRAHAEHTFGRERRISDQIFEAIPDAIFITNTALVIVKCNTAFMQLVNLSREDIIGKRCFDIFECEKSNYCDNGKCLVQEITEDKFTPIIKQAYSPRFEKWLDIRISFVNHDINGFIHILRDITAKIKNTNNTVGNHAGL